MDNRTFILKGNFCYTPSADTLVTRENSYLICEDGISRGIFPEIPEKYKDLPLVDCRDQVIIPGLVDLHLHAPQFAFRSVGMDMELLEWLEQVAFPQEARYQDPEYAHTAYSIFAQAMKKSPTTRASMFATLHPEATVLLMDLMEETGLKTYVGKVNMDRNSPDYLREKTPLEAEKDTRNWVESTLHKYRNVRPILTPRFTPSCTDDLMKRLSQIQKDYQLPLQSHLSENLGEIEWVKELCPNTRFYGEAYAQFNLFGLDCPTIMAHCVHSSPEEIALMKENGVYVAHCPQSNTNLASGSAPVRKYLDAGLSVGLGSDIAGGYSECLFRAMAEAIQVSKLRWRLVDDSLQPLNLTEVFYMATKGGGSFFGKTGSFEEGYELDAVILNDSTLPTPLSFSLKERLERLVYMGDDRNVSGKFVSGTQIF